MKEDRRSVLQTAPFLETGRVPCVGESVHDMQECEERLRFETFLTDLLAQFAGVSSKQVSDQINDALLGVCELIGIDLAVLWQWSATDGEASIQPTHVYGAGGNFATESLIQDQFPWCVKEILAGHSVVVSSVDELPDEAAIDAENCRLLGIKSNLTLPLRVEGETAIGALGFNAMRTERSWPPALVRRLQVVSEVFAVALARERADVALRISEERLALATEAAGAGPWVLNVERGRFWVGPKIMEMFGLPPGETLDLERFFSLVHAGDLQHVREVIERALRTGEFAADGYRIVRPDGQVRWMQSRGRMATVSTEGQDCFTGITSDITERKKQEYELRSSEGRIAAASDAAGMGFYETGEDARVAFFDDRIREILGVPSDGDTDGRAHWLARIHPEDLERVSGLRIQFQSGTLDRIDLEYRYLHPSRGVLWLHHVARVLKRNPAGVAVHAVGVISEVTEAKLAEAELRERLNVETLVADLSSSFVKVVEGNLSLDVVETLERICTCLGAETGAIWMAPDDGRNTVLLTHIWRCDGLSPVPLLLDARDHFPWVLAQLCTTESTCTVLDPETLPPEAAKDRETYARFGVKNSLNVSLLASDGQLHGVFALNFARDAKLSPLLVGRVEMLGRILLTLLVREREERALVAGRERMRLLTEMLDAAPGGVLIHDELGRVLYANRWTMELHGYEAAEFVRLTLSDLVEPEASKLGKRYLQRVIEKGEDSFDIRHRRKDGSALLLRVTARKTLWNDRPAILSVHLDITERDRAGEALKKALDEVQALRRRLEDENVYLRQQIRSESGHGVIVGESESIKKMLAMARKVAPMDSAVLIPARRARARNCSPRLFTT